MKYFIYISDSKVDMLLSQIPHKEKRKIATRLGINLKLITVERTYETETKENRITRLEAVVSFIREYGNLGSVNEPDEYVQDTMLMSWAQHPVFSDAVCFYGEVGQTIVGLGGSLKHVMGFTDQTPTLRAMSWDSNFQSKLWRELNLNKAEEKAFYGDQEGRNAFDAVYITIDIDKEDYLPKQKLEFLAKRLVYRRKCLDSKHNILMASPLFVAMAD